MKSSWETISSFGWHQAGIPREIVRDYCFNSPIVKGHTQSLLRISSLLPGWSHFKGISPDRGSYLCCKPLHSLVRVSHLFNKWGVHEKWWRWRHGGRRKEVSGGGHSSKRKERLPSVICVRATLRGGGGEPESWSVLANRMSKMIRDDVFSRAKCQVSRRKGSKSASRDTLSGVDQVFWISRINGRLCFLLLYLGFPLIFA